MRGVKAWGYPGIFVWSFYATITITSEVVSDSSSLRHEHFFGALTCTVRIY